ncbi:hypothetical protein HZS_5190, partial [Henneguya salminicola]
IIPIEQDDGPEEVVSIQYSDKFIEAYSYFRAIFKSQEKSERALDITAAAILMNDANYTVWSYRREILKFLNSNISKEIEFVSEHIQENPKNYQMWYHRMVLVEWCGDFSDELVFTAQQLAKDHKNYHAWQHRIWVLNQTNQWNTELEHIENMLNLDILNNSAWHQRYQTISKTSGFSTDVINKEIDFVFNKINIVCNNESAWNYLLGIIPKGRFNEFVYILDRLNDIIHSNESDQE